MTLTPHRAASRVGWLAWVSRRFPRQFKCEAAGDSESRTSATAEPARHSIGAGVRPAIWRVILAIKAIVVKAAANETMSSIAKVIAVHTRHVTSAEANHVTPADATDATSAKAADVTSAEAAHVASAKAAHMASAATTSMSSATSTATSGLCISGKKATGKHRARQNHHYSSSHDILLWDGRDLPPQGLVRRRRVRGRQMPTSRWT
jgi:hypothetical protein